MGPALLAVLFFAACGGGAVEEEAAVTDSSSAERGDAAPAPDSLHLRLAAPERVAPGDTVPLTLQVENASDGPVELHLRGREIAFDLVVTRADGTVVWRRLEGEVIPAILRLETLVPEEVLTLEGSWDQRTNDGDPVAPDVYTVHGELLTDADPLVTPADTLRIVPGQ